MVKWRGSTILDYGISFKARLPPTWVVVLLHEHVLCVNKIILK